MPRAAVNAATASTELRVMVRMGHPPMGVGFVLLGHTVNYRESAGGVLFPVRLGSWCAAPESPAAVADGDVTSE
jgi:hypothetical protein